MNLYKKICTLSISIAAIAFTCLCVIQMLQKYNSHHDLEIYYSRELEELYTHFYAVDINSWPIWSQADWEKLHEKLVDQMLTDGFNRQQIKRMENAGRTKASETRRFSDELLRKNNTKKIGLQN